MPRPVDETLLEVQNAAKAFPGVKALDGVDFLLCKGEVHALMGENGAGKSTLIKVITGVYSRDEGEILLEGASIRARSPGHAQQLGISTVYQEINLIPYLSVAENIFLGRQPKRWGRIEWGRIQKEAKSALARLELDLDVRQPLNQFSVAVQQMVAIARALSVEAKVLILDEPTSSLDAREVKELFSVMRKLCREGLGILFVTHFLDQAYEVTDRITVLRNGKKVGTYRTASIPQLELVSKMIGRDVEEIQAWTTRQAPPREKRDGPPALRASQLGAGGAVNQLNLSLGKGEVVGLAGLLGSGRTEAAKLLFGILRPDQGKIFVGGREIQIKSPRGAIREGIGFSPEDRRNEGLLLELSIRENIILALQARRGWLRYLSRAKQAAIADRFMKGLRIDAPHCEKQVSQLSGGNQQKVLLARWLALEPTVLILDEPTRGIDVGAKAEVETLVAEVCRDGMAVVFISSELEEEVRNCHCVVVLRDRRQVGTLAGEEIAIDSILSLIAEGERKSQ